MPLSATAPQLLALSRVKLVMAALVLGLADWGSSAAGGSLFPGAPLDELAHVLSTLIVLWAFGPRPRWRFIVPALVASAMIDVDHVPDRLGVDWITAGTQRPYTHSLLMIAVVIVIAIPCSRLHEPLLGVAAGLAIHYWRDMGEGGGGVPLLWPFSDHSFRYRHALFVAAMVGFVLIDAARCRYGARPQMKLWLKTGRG